MRNRDLLRLFFLVATIGLSACQKVDPQVLLLGSGNYENPTEPPIPVTPGLGQITNGSGTLESSGYRLKGRVVAVPSAPEQSLSGGGYKLKGTLSF
ncbi:MAG: hypothetical protein KF789_09040 [Bdellovibrionaceae bacterium]|nr:hypothetical protein [Pseudobdellovibrionaceae bacterium]